MHTALIWWSNGIIQRSIQMWLSHSRWCALLHLWEKLIKPAILCLSKGRNVDEYWAIEACLFPTTQSSDQGYHWCRIMDMEPFFSSILKYFGSLQYPYILKVMEVWPLENPLHHSSVVWCSDINSYFKWKHLKLFTFSPWPFLTLQENK